MTSLWFFGAFNPQQRKNYYLTQTFHAIRLQNKVTHSVLCRQDHLGGE